MKQKVYITKYALTAGITENEAEVKPSCYNDSIYYASVVDNYGGFTSYRVGTDAFYTLEEAVNNAEKKRLKKIESLKKQIVKLEKLKFGEL